MKRYIILACVLFVLGLAFSANAALVWRLNFDVDPVVNLADYTPGANDFITTPVVSKTFPAYLGSGPWRDYGDMQPDPGVHTGNFPDIVTPPTAGFQGGNAFYTCAGSPADPQQHIGYYIAQGGQSWSMTGDFTAEVICMVAKIGTMTDPVADSEYSLQNVFGTTMIANEGANWEMRIWPDGIIGGNGKMQLCMSGNGGAGEVNIDGPVITPNQWYHFGFTYTAATNTAEFFVDGVSRGTASPNWGGNSTQNDWWIGAWPSNGANRGMAGWIDAVCISDTVLTPSTFNLPRAGYSTIQNWEMH